MTYCEAVGGAFSVKAPTDEPLGIRGRLSLVYEVGKKQGGLAGRSALGR
jgi:hypothetical protein